MSCSLQFSKANAVELLLEIFYGVMLAVRFIHPRRLRAVSLNCRVCLCTLTCFQIEEIKITSDCFVVIKVGGSIGLGRIWGPINLPVICTKNLLIPFNQQLLYIVLQWGVLRLCFGQPALVEKIITDIINATFVSASSTINFLIIWQNVPTLLIHSDEHVDAVLDQETYSCDHIGNEAKCHFWVNIRMEISQSGLARCTAFLLCGEFTENNCTSKLWD